MDSRMAKSPVWAPGRLKEWLVVSGRGSGTNQRRQGMQRGPQRPLAPTGSGAGLRGSLWDRHAPPRPGAACQSSQVLPILLRSLPPRKWFCRKWFCRKSQGWGKRGRKQGLPLHRGLRQGPRQGQGGPWGPECPPPPRGGAARPGENGRRPGVRLPEPPGLALRLHRLEEDMAPARASKSRAETEVPREVGVRGPQGQAARRGWGAASGDNSDEFGSSWL